MTIYIVGSKIGDSTNLDMAVYKLDSDLNLIWEKFYDFHGLNDHANSIKIGSSGEIYLTGYSTRQGLGKEIAILKADSNGNIIWQNEITGSGGQDDEGVKLSLTDNEKLFITAKVKSHENYDFGLYHVNTNGEVTSSAFYDGGGDDFPQDIAQDEDGNIVVTGVSSTSPSNIKNITIKYNAYENDYLINSYDSISKHLYGNIIIKFNRNYIIGDAINKVNFRKGILSDFVDSTCLEHLVQMTGHDWRSFPTSKIFQKLTIADSLSITRLGDTISMTDHWTTLMVDIPRDWSIISLSDSLTIENEFIEYAMPNYIVYASGFPHDELFLPGLKGLYESVEFSEGHINVEKAWDLEVGKSNIKVGIIDGPVNWTHAEFNGSISNLPGPSQKIGGGFNFVTGNEITLNDHNSTFNHGNATAGIVGAKRNNYLPGNDSYAEGIAGIAGGDLTQNNMGVQLYPMVATHASQGVLSDMMDAIANSIYDSPNSPYGFGLHILNISMGITAQGNNAGPYPNKLMEDAWRNHVIVVASRGNSYGVDPLQGQQDNPACWPACAPDKHILNVGASGTDGYVKRLYNEGLLEDNVWYSLIGRDYGNNYIRCDMDVLAPGIRSLVTSTTQGGYITFNGTSAAAPHVAGVVALMKSKHQPINGYPNNLVIEDVEAILQKTARGVTDGEGYTVQNAHGIIDAYLAVSQVCDPYYVKHVKAENFVQTEVFTPPAGITLQVYHGPNNPWVTDLPSGQYSNWERYKFEGTISESLPVGHKIIDYWNVEAFTIGGTGNYTPQTGQANYIQSAVGYDPIGLTTFNATISTYIYKINGMWYPRNPSELRFGYSLHVHKSPDAGISSVSVKDFILYPNPSNSNIKIVSNSNQRIKSVEIYDITGRVVQTTEFNNSEITAIEINISELSYGMYRCRIICNDSEVSIPFIKQSI